MNWLFTNMVNKAGIVMPSPKKSLQVSEATVKRPKTRKIQTFFALVAAIVQLQANSKDCAMGFAKTARSRNLRADGGLVGALLVG